jgi:uncharacterized repeat protein (TIGR01451 family)
MVDLVLVTDTSSTMLEELAVVCGGIADVMVDLEGKGIDVRYRILGISESSDCTSDDVAHLIGDARANHPQDWGPAIRDLSAGYAWQPGRIRLVIPMSDAGAEDGGASWDMDDTKAIDVAILAARSNGVRAAPVLAAGAPAGANAPAHRLARDTGGRVVYSTDPGNDLLDGIAAIVKLAALDADGDGIPDCRDADVSDPCLPRPAFCLPAQDCGASSTPNLDDDGDGQAGEEADDDVDTDGDGLIDEDVGGTECTFPFQDCGVNSSRNLDDDQDGTIDEEVDNGLDDDGDGYIDEDISCACPAEQDTGINDTPYIDDDHDGRSDEEVDDGLDNDGDGCRDEDIAAHQVGGLAMGLCANSPVPGLLCPVANVQVRAGTAAETRTGAAGAYDLSLDPGVYDFEFASPGYLMVGREGVSVNVSERVRVDALMVLEGCSPPTGSCGVDLQGLVPLWTAETGALNLSAEGGAFLDGTCRYSRRVNQSEVLRAAAGFVFPTVSLFDGTGETGPRAILENLVDCLEMDLYSLLQDAGVGAYAAVQELHNYAEWDSWSSTLAVVAMPATVRRGSQPQKAELASEFHLHVHDLQTGGHLGRVGDIVERTISGSYMVDAPIQIAFIHDAQSEYLVEVAGAGASAVDLALVHPKAGGTFGKAVWQQITTTFSSTASLSVGLHTSQYRLALDVDGDGDVDQELTPSEVGALEYAEVYLPGILRGSTPLMGHLNRPPNVPASLWPTDGLVKQSTSPKLGWLGGDPDWDDVTYYVYVEAGDATPDAMVCNGTSEPSCDPGQLDVESHYYWQVWARDDHGATTVGPVWEFTTGSILNHPPNRPREPSPADGAVNQSVDIDLAWIGGDADGDVVTYKVHLGLVDPPATIVCAGTTNATCDPGSLGYDTQYYWFVEATDERAETTMGPVWEFATEPHAPDFRVSKQVAPTVVGPGDSLTYTVRFSNDGEVAGQIERIHDALPIGFGFQGMDTSSDLQVPPAGVTGTITWQGPFTVAAQSDLDLVYRVQATAELGSFVNSVTATMRFGHPPPSPGAATVVVTNHAPITPTLPGPADGAIDQSIDVDLNWVGADPDGDSLSYDVYLDLWNPPTMLACNDAINPTCEPGTLDYESLYYWAVKATDEHGLTSLGPTWSFSTEPDLRGICYPAETIACNATHTGNNGGPGSTNRIDSYPCSSWAETGPEYAYRFVPAASGFVSVTISDLTADLDIHILNDAGGQCLADNCVDGDDASISFSARAGQAYYLVVDGYKGAVGDYTIRTACVTNTVQADLAITKHDTPDPVLAGTSLTYTLSVTNNGPSKAASVLVTDRLPDSVTFDAVSSSPLCGAIAGTVSCELGALRNGEETQFDIVVAVGFGASGLMPNSVHVTSFEFDPFEYNNQSAVVTWAFGPGGVCTPARSISCGESDSANNGGPDSTDLVDYYSCVDWEESGPEVGYAFVPDVSGQVSAVLSDLSADLDLFVLRDDGGRCNSEKCLAFGDTEATFEVSAGQTYYLVVDGFEGAVGNYTLTVDCLGSSAARGSPGHYDAPDTGHIALSNAPFPSFSTLWKGAWPRLDPVGVGMQRVCALQQVLTATNKRVPLKDPVLTSPAQGKAWQ